MYCRARDCVIAFGIPLSAEEYSDWTDNPRGRDLITSQNISWAQYRREIVDLAEKMIPAWQFRGVKVVAGVNSRDFASLFLHPDIQVVILVSHWKDATIELFDGLIDVHTLAHDVPDSFHGIVDLCVCRSMLFAKLLKETRKLVVKFVDTDAVYRLWFYIYTAVFNLLDNRDLTYIQALEEVLKSFAPRRQ